MGRISYAMRDRQALWDGRLLWEWVPGIVAAVTDQFDPERVLLFGSVARGTDGPDPDIDLLVVFDHADPAERRCLMSDLRRAARHIAAPHDLAATDVDTYERDRRRAGRIEHEAATSGTLVCERSAA